MLWQLFAFGTLWFWVLPLIAVVSVAWCLELENNSGAIFTFVAFLIAIVLFTDVPIGVWLNEHSFMALTGIAVYFAGITAWMYVKWEFYTSKKMRKYKELKNDFYKDNDLKLGPIPSKLESEWKREVEYAFGHKSLPLRAREHKAALMAWGINWPISLVWTMINDPIVQFAKTVYYHLSTYFDERSKAKYEKVESQFHIVDSE